MAEYLLSVKNTVRDTVNDQYKISTYCLAPANKNVNPATFSVVIFLEHNQSIEYTKIK